MAAGFDGFDSSQAWARPSCGTGGGGKERGEEGSGAKDRGGVASYGRRASDGAARLLCSLEEEERDRNEKPPGHATG